MRERINIELFSCSGGMALGFRRADIEFDLAIDFDPCAIASYEANLGHRPLQMDARDFLRLLRAGWRPDKRVGLLVADPPCTPWSRAGKRKGQDDERDMLAETMAIIELLLPERWLIANVPGLDDASHWDKVVKRVIGATAVRLGYCVDYASLNAANYGVPQMRVRPFWFAHRGGTECIRRPAPTHGDPRTMESMTLPGVEPLLPWVTCRDSLSHLPLKELDKPVRLKWRNPDHRASAPGEPAKTQTRNTNSDGCLLVNPRHAPAEPDAPAPTIGAKDRGGQSSNVMVVSGKHPANVTNKPSVTIRSGGDGHAGPDVLLQLDDDSSSDPEETILAVGTGPRAMMRPHETDRPARTLTGNRQDSSHILSVSERHTTRADRPALTQTAADDEWPWNRPSTTVCRDERIPPPGHHSGKSYMSRGVKLSEKARLILQSFPEDWKLLSKTKTGRSSMLGQAMPPQLAEPVARSIGDHIAQHTTEDDDDHEQAQYRRGEGTLRENYRVASKA